MANETNEGTHEKDEEQGTGGRGFPIEELVEGLEEQVPTPVQELEAARQEASQNLELAQRSQAELANYRRRVDEERIAQQKYFNGQLLAKLLPVLDDLDLAIAQAGEHTTNAPWLEGVRLIQRKLFTVLESEGVTKIDANGAMFNPLEHEAVDMEATTKYLPGHITRVLRHGYRLRDRVVQPARVVVAKEPTTFKQSNDSLEVKETGQ